MWNLTSEPALLQLRLINAATAADTQSHSDSPLTKDKMSENQYKYITNVSNVMTACGFSESLLIPPYSMIGGGGGDLKSHSQLQSWE